MMTKKQLIQTFTDETDISKFLHSKLHHSSAGYRPTPDQRSTLELLHYLCYGPGGAAFKLAQGNWDWYDKRKKELENMVFEDFPEAMDFQANAVKGAIESFTDQDLKEKMVPCYANRKEPALWKGKRTMGHELMETTFKWIIAYRMQLFLYAKSIGVKGLGSTECWLGKDKTADASE